MEDEEIDQIIRTVKAPIHHPLFYPRIFALCVKQQRRKRSKDAVHQILMEEYEEFSRRFDRAQIQESCAVRNVLRTRQLAQTLIDEKGELQVSLLEKAISCLEEHLYSLGPQRQYDGIRQEHILKVLKLLRANQDLVRLLKKFTRPWSNQWAEDLIRQTLQLPLNSPITDAHTRQAVLAAWLGYLRQNVGSCFATAPAEIIHDEQPELFLQDLLDLISTGSLKRTFGGVEHSVPLSGSWGSGDLKKPLVIQTSSQGITPELWYSPSLIAALEVVGIFKPSDKLKQKMEQLEGWLRPMIHHGPHSIKIVTVGGLLRKILMQTLGVTEKQLEDFENRPQAMIQTSLMMHPRAVSKNAGGIAERCRHFHHLFHLAKNVFKSSADHALLKAWEFTLASFCDTRNEFTRWNLYASLGLGSNEAGGIGECIYQTIQQKLEIANRKVQEIQYEYETVYTQVKTLESRMRHASSEKEAQWLKVEYQSRVNEFYFLEERRDHAQKQAAALVNLYDNLYTLYVDLFKDYFQEVYDADMQEVTSGPFDDSPAGFRLLYKHGRSNTSQWTLIHSPNEYVESLASFFVATESQIAHFFEGKKIEKDLSDVVTAIINHVRTKEFLESAFSRMAAAHHAPVVNDPLHHLDQIEKKPWAYTSGGTMNTLISTYYRLEIPPTETAKWVESEVELLVFLAETLQRMSPSSFRPFQRGGATIDAYAIPHTCLFIKTSPPPFSGSVVN